MDRIAVVPDIKPTGYPAILKLDSRYLGGYPVGAGTGYLVIWYPVFDIHYLAGYRIAENGQIPDSEPDIQSIPNK